MKGIGRGTIQRCDARPLTAPFLLMFHNYYHAINSNGTGGRPLRKRHSSARIINIYVSDRRSAAENSLSFILLSFSPLFPFFLSSFFFFEYKEKGFLDLSPTVHFFPLHRFGHTFPSSRAITPEHGSKVDRILAFDRSAGSHSRFSNPPIFLLRGFEFLLSILDPRGKSKAERGEDSLECLIRKFYRKFHFEGIQDFFVSRRFYFSRFFLFSQRKFLQRFTANLENV